MRFLLLLRGFSQGHMLLKLLLKCDAWRIACIQGGLRVCGRMQRDVYLWLGRRNVVVWGLRLRRHTRRKSWCLAQGLKHFSVLMLHGRRGSDVLVRIQRDVSCISTLQSKGMIAVRLWCSCEEVHRCLHSRPVRMICYV